jgi:hypothetical protein
MTESTGRDVCGHLLGRGSGDLGLVGGRRTLAGLDGVVSAVAVTLDGRHAASASRDKGRIKIILAPAAELVFQDEALAVRPVGGMSHRAGSSGRCRYPCRAKQR